MTTFTENDLARLRDYYPEKPGKLAHQLLGHPLLTLESLVELGKRLPRSSVEYNAGDLPYGVEPDAVGHTGLSVEDTIRRIEQCGSWMVLKNVDQDPAYKALLEETLAELAGVIEPVSGEMLCKVGFIFVSSPGAVTPFHLDPEHNVLLQIRGRKTIMIVPGDESVVPPEKHEAYHVGGHRNVPWHDDYEARGHKFELTPGDAVHVPLMWPHWVKNGPEPSISFSITWKSRWVYEEAAIRGMNHLLRRIGVTPASPAPFPKRNPAKAYAYRAIRKAQAQLGR
ncbi:MAG TPA: cupin-like domain-containing protein [Allosphingosinicella sp.]|nr:cupin-like domain-containing protein [Allosphingosinicella sp.]